MLATKSFNFCLSEKVFISLSLLKDNFSGYRILGCWLFSSSQHFKYLTSLSSRLHSFWGESKCNSYLCSSIIDLFFPLVSCRSGFFLIFDFSVVWLVLWLGVVFFGINLSFLDLWFGAWHYFAEITLTNEILSYYGIKYFCCSFLSCFLCSHYGYVF